MSDEMDIDFDPVDFVRRRVHKPQIPGNWAMFWLLMASLTLCSVLLILCKRYAIEADTAYIDLAKCQAAAARSFVW